MKGFFIILALLMFLPFVGQSRVNELSDYNDIDAIKFMFCAGETQHEGVLCSDIMNYTFPVLSTRRCRIWVSDNNLTNMKIYKASSKNLLEAKQLEVCDRLLNKSKWTCFIIEDCGMTSSISPLGGVQAFAPSGDVEQARDNCVINGWPEFQQALIGVNHGCKIAPDAAELMF